MIVDTHIHIWDLNRAEYPWLEKDRSLLKRTWRINELETERKIAGITMGVLVQASGNLEDTNLMLETAANTDWISGVVCWLPLIDPDRTHRLLDERFLKEQYFKGVRHQIHDEKDQRWLLQPTVIESLKLLERFDIPYDVVAISPGHIETAIKVAEKVPGLRMVFDHLSQPPISSGQKFGDWGKLMQTAAQHKNFFAKISGLGTASGNFKNRKPDDILPYIEFALEQYGVDRCFCGGDWPVSMLRHNYNEAWSVYKQILKQLLSETDLDKVFHSNAVSFYDLRNN